MTARSRLLVALLTGFVFVGVLVGSMIIFRLQQDAVDEQINARIAGKLKPFIEEQLRTMGATGFVNSLCGEFRSLDAVHLYRSRTLHGGYRRALTGVARFEKVDVNVGVKVIFEDSTDVELEFWPDENWLKENPIAGDRIVDRRLVTKQLEISLPDGTPAYISSARISGSATYHPSDHPSD